MKNLVWMVKDGERGHVITYTERTESGEVELDGEDTAARDSRYMGVVMEKAFEIDGKEARLKRRGLISGDWTLELEGKTQAPEK